MLRVAGVSLLVLLSVRRFAAARRVPSALAGGRVASLVCARSRKPGKPHPGLRARRTIHGIIAQRGRFVPVFAFRPALPVRLRAFHLRAFHLWAFHLWAFHLWVGLQPDIPIPRFDMQPWRCRAEARPTEKADSRRLPGAVGRRGIAFIRRWGVRQSADRHAATPGPPRRRRLVPPPRARRGIHGIILQRDRFVPVFAFRPALPVRLRAFHLWGFHLWVGLQPDIPIPRFGMQP